MIPENIAPIAVPPIFMTPRSPALSSTLTSAG
jgi:hypothetical protein